MIHTLYLTILLFGNKMKQKHPVYIFFCFLQRKHNIFQNKSNAYIIVVKSEAILEKRNCFSIRIWNAIGKTSNRTKQKTLNNMWENQIVSKIFPPFPIQVNLFLESLGLCVYSIYHFPPRLDTWRKNDFAFLASSSSRTRPFWRFWGRPRMRTLYKPIC